MANKALTQAFAESLDMWNKDTGKGWQVGTNWSNVNTEFETFINKYFFPKINETLFVEQALGNSFDWLAQEIDFIGQYSEEYVILDTVPVAMNLSKSEELLLKREYPRVATKLFSEGILKKVKFTLNNNDVRLNFQTLGDAVRYAGGVYERKISDINVSEEREIRAMLIDYANTLAKDHREVTSMEELGNKLFTAVLNLQNNSEKHNEADTASGGAIGRYTTVSRLEDLAILTTDDVKSYLLDTKIANTFANSGIDLTDIIISFDDLGGVFKMNEDITISEDATITKFKAMGDYQIEKGDIIPKGDIVTFDVTGLTEFTGKVTEVKPKDELFAMVFDIRAVRYKRYTKGMLKEPFYNPEFDEVTHFIHYYSSKYMSPFYNKIVIEGKGA